MIDDFKIENKEKFSKEDLNVFKKIVTDANEVGESTFDGLMGKNPLLLICKEKGLIIGTGALKIPNERYKNTIFNKSKTDFQSSDFTYELGWIVSKNEGKGIGRKMTEALANYKASLYATVRKNNLRMRNILEGVGFTFTGESYDSDRGDYKICLYVKINL